MTISSSSGTITNVKVSIAPLHELTIINTNRVHIVTGGRIFYKSINSVEKLLTKIGL